MLYINRMNKWNKLPSFDDHLKEALKDPEFRREYEALEPEFALYEMLIEARMKKGFTQEQLAKKMGTKQSAISRFESGRVSPRWDFILKLTQALGARIKIEKI